MKKNKQNLKGTVRKMLVEYYVYRPSKNLNLTTVRIWDSFQSKKHEPVRETIKRLVEELYYGEDIYKIRIRYDYYRAKRRVKTRRTNFFYVRGEIKPKQEVSEYFSGINRDEGQRINSLPGDNVFWIHYTVHAWDSKHNYELLPYFEAKQARA